MLRQGVAARAADARALAGETQSCEGFETLIALTRDVDPDSAELYWTAILPDEYKHAAIGRRALTLLCDTPVPPECCARRLPGDEQPDLRRLPLASRSRRHIRPTGFRL